MTEKIKWGVISPGKIAHVFAKGVRVIPDAEIIAVASSNKERAKVFASEYKVSEAYDSYEALVANPDVEAVYISSLHHQHFEHSMLALKAGKHVLCEKPMTVNALEAKKLIDTAREKKLFLMEALWTRFLPIYDIVRQWLDDRRIGEIKLLTSTFGFLAEEDESSRLFNPNLAGGSLLDIGIYPLAVSEWVMGAFPETMKVHALMGNTGVDELLSVILVYENGVVSQFTSTFLAENMNDFFIYGKKGYIRIHPKFWGGTQATLSITGKKDEVISAPFRAAGFEYQTKEAIRCIRAGLLESPVVSHDYTLSMMKLMDSIREEIGLKYPFE
ncbi:MAG: Gfo/Idh/MocA family oxidoreductase [Anaerolineae bacterium]|jgi:predicted dehydrogenase|nr:Gfo/Idh/MocA family oxidoreductase [Anaerolineae bacterium]MBT7074854.1 Gfo/Idh/MocA family oxidoreductase [Anaerolineae bacterium]MBT7782501.1 Gfo/Idh/MocA family oxidoreductase [Anaerolineae bacterium]